MDPIIYLDVDGVLNAVPVWDFGTQVSRAHPKLAKRTGLDDHRTDEIIGFRITWSPTVVAKVIEWSNRSEVRWLTTWKDHAVDDLSPVLGLPRFEVIHPAPGYGWWKFNEVLRSCEEEHRPIVWIDDDIDWQETHELEVHPDVVTFVPDSNLGLTAAMLVEIDEVLERIHSR